MKTFYIIFALKKILWNVNKNKTRTNAIALILVQERVYVVIAFITTGRWVNCRHVISLLMQRKRTIGR
jgi:hypothetical protein